jgi:hypothetical protein
MLTSMSPVKACSLFTSWMPGLRLVLAQLVDQPHELELEACQDLAQLVVQFPCNTGTLFLPRDLHSERQCVESVCTGRPMCSPRLPASGRRAFHVSPAVMTDAKGGCAA